MNAKVLSKRRRRSRRRSDSHSWSPSTSVAVGSSIMKIWTVKNFNLGEVLTDIYLRKISKWNDPKSRFSERGRRTAGQGHPPVCPRRLKRLSPGNLHPVPGARKPRSSKKAPGTTKSPKWPSPGVTGKGRERAGVAEFVKNTSGTIGSVELAFAKNNNLAFATMLSVPASRLAIRN